ncbi:MAG: hypothetical protein ACOH2M_24805 [Cypionkella sp.]
MAQDTVDLLKVMVVSLVIFAVSTMATVYLLVLFRAYAGSVPVIGSLPTLNIGTIIPALAETRLFVILGAMFVMASGITLLLTSVTVDMAMLIIAKAMTLLITTMFGVLAGLWGYVRLTVGTDLALPGINQLAIALIVFFVLSSVLRTATFRGWGGMRFVAAASLIILAPVLLVSL